MMRCHGNECVALRYGSRLILRSAASTSSLEALLELAAECGARAVYANRVYEPWKVGLGR